MDNKMRQGSLLSVQAVRAIAALMVVFYHGSALVRLRFSYDVHDYFWWCYSGVDTFFVLSGFIIVYSTLCQHNLLRWEFLARRLVRIYPVYWAAILFVIALSSLGQIFKVNADSNTLHAMSNTSISNLLGAFLLIPKSSEIIKVAWTLSYEMTFYLLFAWLFFKNRTHFFYVMFAWSLTSLIAAFYFRVDYSNTDSPILALLNPIMIEFLLGCFAAYFFYNIKPSFLIKTVAALGLILGLYFLSDTIDKSYLRDIPTTNQYFRFAQYGVPSFMILIGMLYLPIKYPKVLLFLGDASYSIYLFHYPILGIIAKLLLASGILVTNIIWFEIFISISVGVCCLVYWFIEKPLLDFGKREIKKLKNNLVPEGVA